MGDAMNVALHDFREAAEAADLLAEKATVRAALQPIYADAPMPKKWYMLRVVPNRELKIEDRLLNRGVCVELPKERRPIKTGWNRQSLRQAAIFSGTMFIPDFDADLHRLKAMAEGIIGWTRCDNWTVTLRPKAMDKIRAFERFLALSPSERRKVKVGSKVRVSLDLNFGSDVWMGTVANLDSHSRLTVLVPMLGRMVRLNVSEDQVEAE